MRIIILLVAAFSFAGATSAEAKCGSGSQAIGMVVGGVLGGLLGAKIDGGRKNTVGTLIGGALGAVAGGAIAKALDKCEVEKMGQATEAALNGPDAAAAPQTWASDTREGVKGTVSVGAPTRTADGKLCRTARRINYIDGQEMSDTPTYCRTPPSSTWMPQTV